MNKLTEAIAILTMVSALSMIAYTLASGYISIVKELNEKLNNKALEDRCISLHISEGIKPNNIKTEGGRCIITSNTIL